LNAEDGTDASRIEGSGQRSLRRPKLSARKFSAWKKKKDGTDRLLRNVGKKLPLLAA